MDKSNQILLSEDMDVQKKNAKAASTACFSFGKQCLYINNSVPLYDSSFYICLGKQLHTNKNTYIPLSNVTLPVALLKYRRAQCF